MRTCLILIAALTPSLVHAEPIHDAVWKGDLAKLEALLKADAKLVTLAEGGRNGDVLPLHIAAERGDTRSMELLLCYGADKGATSRNGTPLQVAALYGKKAAVELLLARGATLDIFSAAALGRKDTVEPMLRENPKLLQQTGPRQETPLSWAIAAEGQDVVEFLIDAGADVNARSVNGDTPLHDAVSSGSKPLVAALIARGAKVNAKGYGGHSPLWRAVSRGERPIVELLLRHGADPTLSEDRVVISAFHPLGRTPLHLAADSGDLEVLQLLLNHRAPVNVKDSAGNTPLQFAKNKAVADLLRKHGARE